VFGFEPDARDDDGLLMELLAEDERPA